MTTAEANALELVARLPLAPITYLAPFTTTGDRSTLYRQIARLSERGLVATFDGPPHGHCRPRRLLLITNLGLAVLALRHRLDPRDLVREWGLGRSAFAALTRQLPAVLSTYELLALLAATHAEWKPSLVSWHRPWVLTRSRPTSASSRRVGVRLPAFASLVWRRDSQPRHIGSYVMVADTGGLPAMALRSRLLVLAQIRRTAGTPAPVIAVATSSRRRVDAWAAMLDGVANNPRNGYLESCIYTWDSWRSGEVSVPWTDCSAQETKSDPPPVSQAPYQECRSSSHVPRPIDLGKARAAIADWEISAGARAALDIVGRHPFLGTTSVGEILAFGRRSTRKWRRELVRHGLLRMLPNKEVPHDVGDPHELLEATVSGLTMLAGSMGLSLATAVRHHGLAGGGPITPVGTRRALHAHLAHTAGVDRVFVTIARSLRAQRNGVLLEWRNAAACAHGRMRPDGYGLLRMGRRDFGFFVEFDRGTVHPAALRAKFAAYHRYVSRPRATLEYDGFPTLLAVASGPAAEQRIVEAVRAVSAVQGSQLQVLVTTVGWLDSDGSWLGKQLWMEPRSQIRRSWPLAWPERHDKQGRYV